MDYEKTIPFTGNTGKALEAARNVFIQHSFQIIHSSESALELAGTGTMWTRGQIPLIGISKVNIRVGSGNLSIEAEFGGIRRTIKYLVLLIVGMAVFFLVFFGIIFSKQGHSPNKIILISLAPFIPWPVIIPLMAMWFKSRTSQALDVLLHNMVTLGKEP